MDDNDTSFASSSRPLDLPHTLEDKKIKALPPACYYISDFITEKEEKAILDKVIMCPV